ncbi:MAG: hypothetical protein PHI55_07475 [Burkholderiaceae bacterium]|nr:hypothetical protein [Burkholderiaceae bacterium]
MALKKSELYPSLWASCDELRGGMDASQCKVCVLVLRFIQYVSDKYAGQSFAPITLPAGARFAERGALKGRTGMGEQIKQRIVGPLKELADRYGTPMLQMARRVAELEARVNGRLAKMGIVV